MRHVSRIRVWIAGGAVFLLGALYLYSRKRRAAKCSAVKRVLITGAAGQIGYTLTLTVARGAMLGHGQRLSLHLLDVPAAENALAGLKMELLDANLDQLEDVVVTTDLQTACMDVDIAILVGGHPHNPSVNREEFMGLNAAIFQTHARALETHASPDVKVLVVASPANTNAYFFKEAAPSIRPQNVTCLTRLDHNRAVAQVAERTRARAAAVKQVIVWGNRSHSQLVDISHCTVGGTPLPQVAEDVQLLQSQITDAVRERGGVVQRLRGLNTAMSAASAICDHMRSWLLGTPRDEWVSMGVVSDGSYGVEPGLVFSFPVTCRQGQWQIVQGLQMDAVDGFLLQYTMQELLDEREMVESWLQRQGQSSQQH